jgi:hypothetical protein
MASVRDSGVNHQEEAWLGSGAKSHPLKPIKAWVAKSARAQSPRCEARQEIASEWEISLHQGVERYQSIDTLGTTAIFDDESFMGANGLRSGVADQSNRHSLGELGGWGSSSCSGSSQVCAGKPISSVNQWFRSTILQRIEQNGIVGAWISAGKCFRQVGHWISGSEAIDALVQRKMGICLTGEEQWWFSWRSSNLGADGFESIRSGQLTQRSVMDRLAECGFFLTWHGVK